MSAFATKCVFQITWLTVARPELARAMRLERVTATTLEPTDGVATRPRPLWLDVIGPTVAAGHHQPQVRVDSLIQVGDAVGRGGEPSGVPV